MHARVALWSLKLAIERLDAAVASERDEAAGDRGTIRAWAPSMGGGRGSGGRGGLADAVVGRYGGPGPMTRLAAATEGTLVWLIGDMDTALATLDARPPRQLAEDTKWFVELDRKVRIVLRMSSAAEPMTGVSCSACGYRSIVRAPAGSDRWHMLCDRPACVCTGAGCACEMAESIEGARHIW